MDGLSNTDIDKSLSKIHGFRGSFACNDLPSAKGCGSYVINLDKKGGEGTHWCTLFEELDRIVYVDPFGFPPNKAILKWIYSRGKPYYYNTTDIQALNSSKCGKYAIFLIKQHSKGNSIESIIDHLHGEGIRKSELEVKKKY
jgi:hypothetical protein